MTLRDEAQSRDKLEVGLIGAGYWGQKHARVLGDSSRVSRIHVWDRDASASARLAAAQRKSLPADSIERCLARCDALIICSPAATHFDLALLCMSKGIPALVEKPLAVSFNQCVQLFRVAAASGCFLGAGHQYEHHAGIGVLRDWHDAGRFGSHLRIGSVRRGGRTRVDTDVLLDLAIHDITALNRIVGAAPSRVVMGSATCHPDGRTAAATFSMTYPGGQVATVHVDWDGPRERCLSLDGSKGAAVLDEALPPERQLSWTGTGGTTRHHADLQPSSLEAQDDHFLHMARINRFSADEERRVLAAMKVIRSLHEQLGWSAL